MIRAFVKGIMAGISAEYGVEYQKYKEPPEQGLKEPCFLVRCIAPMTIHKIKNRAMKSYTFQITYFPKESKETLVDCLEVGETLSSVLQTITVNGAAVHSTDEISCRVNDGCLHVTVTYEIYAMAAEEAVDSMETLEHTVSAKQED